MGPVFQSSFCLVGFSNARRTHGVSKQGNGNVSKQASKQEAVLYSSIQNHHQRSNERAVACHVGPDAGGVCLFVAGANHDSRGGGVFNGGLKGLGDEVVAGRRVVDRIGA